MAEVRYHMSNSELRRAFLETYDRLVCDSNKYNMDKTLEKALVDHVKTLLAVEASRANIVGIYPENEEEMEER